MSDSAFTSNSNTKIISKKHQLTEEEKLLLELINKTYEIANNQIYADPKTTTPTTTPDVKRTVCITEISVRRLMTFFRSNPDFLNLNENLQSILLKSNMMEILLIHGVVVYNPVSNTFHIPSTKTIYDAKSLEKIYGYDMYTKLAYITRSFYDLCEGDFSMIKIILFVVLFNSTLNELNDDEVQIINDLNMKYMKFLYSYMQYAFGWPNCNLKISYFASLLREAVAIGAVFREATLKN